MKRMNVLTLVTASLLALALAGQAKAQADAVVVYGTEPRAGTEEGGVIVFRGAPSPPPIPRTERAAAPSAAVAGRTLWLIDRAGGRVIGCSLRSSGQVGGKRIRCGDRSLTRLVTR